MPDPRPVGALPAGLDLRPQPVHHALRGRVIGLDGVEAAHRRGVRVDGAVVENGRITVLKKVGTPKLPINPDRRPAEGDFEIDCTGKFLTPGLVDCHAHIGAPFHAENGVMPSADACRRYARKHFDHSVVASQIAVVYRDAIETC